ncbi:MAG: diguanylate cyclase [Lachnospira sp.]|nr:diguanylate cyclase [Lachnospira sp.]
MKKIWEFFENMDECMYVADIDTHELIYMNKKALNIYGFKSVDEVAGKKCYEILQNSSGPCKICNNEDLSVGQFKEWRYFNPILNKHFILKDTIIEDEGRRCRAELALDVTFEEQQKGIVDNYRDLELVVNNGIRVAFQATSPDEEIDIILEYMGKALNADRVYIVEKDEKDFDNNTYEWCADGVEPEKDSLQNLVPDICRGWYDMFGKDKDIVIADIDKLKVEEADVYDILSRQNIKALVAVPLYTDGKISGFYGVDNPPQKYMEYAHNMLQIVGYFISSCIRRRNLLMQLENMSYKDALTKLGNRFLVEKFVKRLDKNKCIGAVYCDITGLKNVNDTQGHEAGDKLILRASDCLKKIFSDYGIFRIGGDEFLVLCPEITEDDLYKKTEQLKECLKKSNSLMAVGAAWRENFYEGLDKLLTESEHNMYIDKSEYYRKAGIERRKF